MELSILSKIDFDLRAFFQTNDFEETFFPEKDWLDGLASSQKYIPHYFTVKYNAKIIAFAPLFLVNKKPFRRFLISLPGGIFTKNPQARKLILDAAIDLTTYEKLDYLSIKDGYDKLDDCRFVENSSYYHMIIKAPKNAANLWSNLKPRARNRVRRSNKTNFNVSRSSNNIEKIHGILLKNYRRLGTPLPSLEFFNRLRLAYGEKLKPVAILENNHLVGGSISIISNQCLNVIWYSSLPESFHKYSNYKLYWETIKDHESYNVNKINLGTSRFETGNFRFKSQWNATPKQLYTYYFNNDRKLSPDYLQESENTFWFGVLRNFYKTCPPVLLKKINPYFSSFEPLSF